MASGIPILLSLPDGTLSPLQERAASDAVLCALAGNYFDNLSWDQWERSIHADTGWRKVKREGDALCPAANRIHDQGEGEDGWPTLAASHSRCRPTSQVLLSIPGRETRK